MKPGDDALRAQRREEVEGLLAVLEARLARLESVHAALADPPTEDQRDLLQLWAGAALDALHVAAQLAMEFPDPRLVGYGLEVLSWKGPLAYEISRPLQKLAMKHRPGHEEVVLLEFNDAIEVATEGVPLMRRFIDIIRDYWSRGCVVPPAVEDP